jgi:hypothetical protein
MTLFFPVIPKLRHHSCHSEERSEEESRFLRPREEPGSLALLGMTIRFQIATWFQKENQPDDNSVSEMTPLSFC